jgi:transcriptional regulator with XRE-family HTH domain
MELNNFSQAFDRTLRYHRITGKVLSQKTGISQNHISEFRNGGNISAEALSRLLAVMDELAPGAKLYFCLSLAGENPAEFLSSKPHSSLRSLIQAASPQEKAEALKLITNWVQETCAHAQLEQRLEAV